MATNEKGTNRGGIGGQEGELGDETKHLERKHTERSQVDRRGETPGGLRREPDLEGAENPALTLTESRDRLHAGRPTRALVP